MRWVGPIETYVCPQCPDQNISKNQFSYCLAYSNITAKEQAVFHASEIQNPLCITVEESLSSPYVGFYLSFTVRK